MLYEFCAENVTLLEKAMQAGARRVELCDNLSVGGTTPSYGVIRAAVDLAKSYDTTIMTMIRPRGGDFVYTDLEVTRENELDTENLESLLAVSQGLEVVFHMAFDSIPRDKQFEDLDWLAEHGVKRILTHGGPATETIQEHFAWLKELVAYADKRIQILPGGGITTQNRDEIVAELGLDQLHGTKVVF